MSADAIKDQVYGLCNPVPELESLEAELRGARYLIALLAKKAGTAGLTINMEELSELCPNGTVTVHHDPINAAVTYTYRDDHGSHPESK